MTEPAELPEWAERWVRGRCGCGARLCLAECYCGGHVVCSASGCDTDRCELAELEDVVTGGATIDPTGRYRYTLWRDVPELGAAGRCLFVMLNPSTADATTDDATLRRCGSFAAREGFARLDVVNLFALRATKPTALLAAPDPVGPDNDEAIASAAQVADRVFVAWSSMDRRLRWRINPVVDILRANHGPLWCFGRTQDGSPRHPSRLPALAPVERW